MYCDGSERSLSKCRFDHWDNYDCDSSEAAGVICIDERKPLELNTSKPRKQVIGDVHEFVKIRLAGEQSKNEGRVEIKLGDQGSSISSVDIYCFCII